MLLQGAPDLLRYVIEAVPFTRINDTGLEIESLIGIAITKLDHSEWEVRDSALEILTRIAEIYRKSISVFFIDKRSAQKKHHTLRNRSKF